MDKKVQTIDDYTGILKLEAKCETLPQVDCPIVHTFAEGIYTRTMTAPAGTFIIGKRHRHQIVNVLIRGRALVFAGDGKAEEVSAPYTVVSEPYVKKMFHVLDEIEWMTIHPTEETDLELIEKEAIITEPDYVLYIEEQKKIKGGD